MHYYFGHYDPLQYPLLFPYGEYGWHEGIEIFNKEMFHRSSTQENLLNINNINSASKLIEKRHNVNNVKIIFPFLFLINFFFFILLL